MFKAEIKVTGKTLFCFPVIAFMILDTVFKGRITVTTWPASQKPLWSSLLLAYLVFCD